MTPNAPSAGPFVESYLNRAIAEFDVNRLAAQVLRRLAEQFPREFVRCAVSFIETAAESNAYRFLVNLVLRQPDVFEELCNPALRPKDSAVSLLKRFLAVEPTFDTELARRLPNRGGTNRETAFDSQRIARTLDLLEETSSGRRLLTILGHLHDNSDPRISAKAVLFIGRRLQNPQWVEAQLDKPDARTRANAIESLWGLDSRRAKDVLTACLRDQCNRVAGNALLGLSLLKDPGVPGEIIRMSHHPDPSFRSTAAWMMGRLAAPGFYAELRKLMGDESEMVREAALQAIALVPEPPPEPEPPQPEEPEILALEINEAALRSTRDNIEGGRE